jgi:hypothetical protein
MECEPAISELVGQVAVWTVVLRGILVHVDMAVPSAVNVTVSVDAVLFGLKVLADVSVAVKVTSPLTVDAVVGERVRVGVSAFTVWVTVGEGNEVKKLTSVNAGIKVALMA